MRQEKGKLLHRFHLRGEGGQLIFRVYSLFTSYYSAELRWTEAIRQFASAFHATCNIKYELIQVAISPNKSHVIPDQSRQNKMLNSLVFTIYIGKRACRRWNFCSLRFIYTPQYIKIRNVLPHSHPHSHFLSILLYSTDDRTQIEHKMNSIFDLIRKPNFDTIRIITSQFYVDACIISMELAKYAICWVSRVIRKSHGSVHAYYLVSASRQS